MNAIFAQFKFYIVAACIALMLAGTVLYGIHERHVGAAKVQAKWDLANAKQNIVAVEASEKARTTEHTQAAAFAGIESNYIEVTSHAPTPFDLPAALADGSLRLRNDCPAPNSRSVSETTARSRSADAAATQRLADRTASAVRVIRLAQSSDAREAQLAAQVTALQAILSAERNEVHP